MARYSTRKSTSEAKRETLRRRAVRRNNGKGTR